MNDEIKGLKTIFENWFLRQFPDGDETLLNGFSVDDGYKDITINAMWVGFVAGDALSK